MERSVGSAIDNILGKKFKYGGRGPDEFDCLGSCIYLIRECFGIEMPDPFDSSLGGTILERLEKFRGFLVKIEGLDDIRTGDIIHYLNSNKISEQHTGFAENHRWCVLANRKAGICRIQISRIKGFETVQLYRLKELC